MTSQDLGSASRDLGSALRDLGRTVAFLDRKQDEPLPLLAWAEPIQILTDKPDEIDPARIVWRSRLAQFQNLGLIGESTVQEFTSASDSATAAQLGADAVAMGTNLLPAWCLEKGGKFCRAICLIQASGIDYRGEPGAWTGTGILISPNILLTNHHVLHSMAVAEHAVCRFDYQQERNGTLRTAKSFAVRPSRLFLTSPTDGGLDFTFVWVEDVPGDEYGWVRPKRSSFAISQGEFTNIVSHPRGEPKVVALQRNPVESQDELVLHYTGDTVSAGSGACVFNSQWDLVAIQHASRPKSTDTHCLLNEAVKLSAMAAEIERMGQSTDQAAAAREVLGKFEGTDEVLGFFGTLGRSGPAQGNPTSLESVVDVYRGEYDDIDVGFWNIEWFSYRYPEKVNAVAEAMFRMNLDIWVLVESSPAAAKALVERLGTYDLDFDFLAAEPDASPQKQSCTILWNRATVLGEKENWEEPIESWLQADSRNFDDLALEAVEGKIFDRYPVLMRFQSRRAHGQVPFDFYLVPLHLKAMSEGSKRRRMASEILAAAARKKMDQGGDRDWIIGGDFNAALATEDFAKLAGGAFTAISAQDAADGAFSYLKAPHKSLIDHVFISKNLSTQFGPANFFVVAEEKNIPDYISNVSDHRPVLFRMSLKSTTTDDSPSESTALESARTATALGELQAVLRGGPVAVEGAPTGDNAFDNNVWGDLVSPSKTTPAFNVMDYRVKDLAKVFVSVRGSEPSNKLMQDSFVQAFDPVRGSEPKHKLKRDSYLSSQRSLAADSAALERQFELVQTPGTESAVESNDETAAESPRNIAAHESAPRHSVLIELKNPNWSPPPSFELTSQMGTVASGSCSIEGLDALEQDENVVQIEGSRPGGTLSYECSQSVPFTRANQVQRPPIAEMGDQCLIALIDSGIDILHEAFRDAQGRCRIIEIWDQGTPVQNPPNPLNPPKPPSAVHPTLRLNYGRVYTSADIAAFLANPATTPTRLQDPGLHGTHVASIAAGRAVGLFAGGIALDAPLVLVIAEFQPQRGQRRSLGYSRSHFEALSYIDAVAEREAKPVVVNVSLGMNAGGHDGRSLLENGFAMFSENGSKPGRIIVKSAGNERDKKCHAEFSVTTNMQVTLPWESDGSARNEDVLELWYRAEDELHFELVPPDRSPSIHCDSTNPDVSATLLSGATCSLKYEHSTRNSGDSNLLTVIIRRGANPIVAGIWALKITGVKVCSAGWVDAWLERVNSRPTYFTDFVNVDKTLSIPGTAESIICVGAVNSTFPLINEPSSSFGLTRSDGKKPDLVAPGTAIVAAKAQTVNGVWALDGTSMAAPHVTGAIALALSRRKKLGKPPATASQVKQALTTYTQNYSGTHNKATGYGLLDVAATFNELVKKVR